MTAWEKMINAIIEYADLEMDQWDNLAIEYNTMHGWNKRTLFVSLAMEPRPDVQYHPVVRP